MDMEKQTGDRMKETVLLYGFKDQERLKKVKRALLPGAAEEDRGTGGIFPAGGIPGRSEGGASGGK